MPTLLLLLALAGALPWLCAAQQSGVLVEDFQYLSGWTVANSGMTVAPNGTVYSCGQAQDGNGDGHGLILASADAGNTWTLLVDYTIPTSQFLEFDAIATDPFGNLYVAGDYIDYNLTTEYWFVQRSSDGGSTWATVDDFNAGAVPTQPAMTADAAGNVFVAGPTGVGWTTRRGIGGVNFTTVDSVSGYSSKAVFATSAGVFAVGSGGILAGKNKGYSTAWIVRRSTDSGNTWSTVDTFQYSSGQYSVAVSGSADAHGNLYVVGEGDVVSGSGRMATAQPHWLVRKSTNGGSTWSTVDDLANASARRFSADSNGNLFAAGAAGTNTWALRKNPGGIGTWSTVDKYLYASASAGAASIAANASGNLFVAGEDSSGYHWLIKRY